MDSFWSKFKIFDTGANFTNSEFKGKYKGVDVHKEDSEIVLRRSLAYGV